ncbi:ribonuclease R family protein, partial [Accumulibacter sp.]
MSISRPSAVRGRDPYLDREEKRYEQPLPSREYIVQTLADQGRPVSFAALCALLEIRADEQESFARRLRAMERDAQLMRNRRECYLLPERASLIAGRVEGHPDGYGFLIPDDGSEALVLEARQMSKVLHRDRALVRVVGVDRRGRREAAIVEVLERANSRVVGRVLVEHGITLVVPEDRRINQDILVAPDGVVGAQAGEVVTVEIIEQPDRHTKPVGQIVEILGHYADPGMEIEIALRKHQLPFEFSAAALGEAAALPQAIDPRESQRRVDLRDLPLVTIDGENARDFDDAVFAERRGRGWRLVVAIADVSHYVGPATALDRDARERGNSVYFPRRVIPMLPEQLSNELCSLKPDVDRLAMVCDLRIDERGEIVDYRFGEAVFRSHARLTYDQVWAWLSGAAEPQNDVHRALLPRLGDLHSLFKVLAEARDRRGAIDFETIETMMLF